MDSGTVKPVSLSATFAPESSGERGASRGCVRRRPLTRLAQRLSGEARTTLVAFGTEAGLFKGAGIPTVVCGPGSIDQAHQPDEFITLAALRDGEAFLRRLIRDCAA